MRADFYPLQILLLTISGWVKRRQQDVIAYLVECQDSAGRVIGYNDLGWTEKNLRRLFDSAENCPDDGVHLSDRWPEELPRLGRSE